MAKNEVKYRPATMAEIENRDTNLFMNGEQVWVLMIHRSEVISEGEAKLDYIMLTNMKKVQVEDLQVIDNGVPESEEVSLLMRQYNDLKAKRPDSLLLFRCGDFYETYQEDAKECAKILGITLTWRTPSKRHAPGDYTDAMVGFPHHALDQYLPMLIRAGKKVAICDQLPDPPKKPAKRGITETVNANENENQNENKPETSNLKPETNEKEDKTMKPETSNMKPTMAADLIGKTIILGATGAKYVVKSIDGDKLECDFSNGKATIPMSVPVAQAQKFLASGTWKIEGAIANENENQNQNADGSMNIRTEADVAEVDDILPVVTPKTKADGGSKTADVPQTSDIKPQTSEKPAPKVKVKSETRPQTSSVSPQTSKGKLTYSTYTNKKGKECAKIMGFSETDEAYQHGPELHGSASYETNDGKRIYALYFGPRYAAAAKQVCEALNKGKSLTDCKAIIDNATEENAKKREEWKAKAEERKAKRREAKSQKTYTQAELAEWLRKLNAGTDKEKAAAAKFFNDLAKAA